MVSVKCNLVVMSVKCNLLCVVVSQPCLMAVVVPDEEVVKPYALSNGLPTDLALFCQSPVSTQPFLI